jgi:hypothetical protein
MKKILITMLLLSVFMVVSCGDGKKTLSEEGVILIEERSLSEEEIEEECPNGGVKIVTGFDKNGNGVLDEDEIYDTYFVCHGEDGEDGKDGTDGEEGAEGRPGTDGKDGDGGTDGEDGTSTLTEVIPIEEGDEGHDCENGGYWVITCEDDGDGECVEDTEVFEAVCHGVDGEKGEPGNPGDKGADGVCAGNNAPEIDNIKINGTEYPGTPVETFDGVAIIEITATDDNDGDNLIYVVTGSGAIIEQNETDNHKFTLNFNSEGVYYFSVIVSDGCQMAVESFAVDAVCAVDFPNYHDGRCWSDKSSSTMEWQDAMDYCEGMGGKLPNIQELRTLIQNCPEIEYPQPDSQDSWCEIEDPDKLASGDGTDDCSPGCSGDLNIFGDTGWFWSSSVRSDDTDHAWVVDFTLGKVNDSLWYYVNYVRCVK